MNEEERGIKFEESGSKEECGIEFEEFDVKEEQIKRDQCYRQLHGLFVNRIREKERTINLLHEQILEKKKRKEKANESRSYERYRQLQKLIIEQEGKHPFGNALAATFIGFCVLGILALIFRYLMDVILAKWLLWFLLAGIPVALGIVTYIVCKIRYVKYGIAFKLADSKKELDELYKKHGPYIEQRIRAEEREQAELARKKAREQAEHARSEARINRIMGKMNDAALRTAYHSSSSSYSSSTDDSPKTESERRWHDNSGRDGGYIDSQGVFRDNVGRETGLHVDANDRVYNEKSEAVGFFDSNDEFHSF